MMNAKGNILFLILIAVALFAALSYAITGTSRNNSSNIAANKLKLQASQMLQYAARAENAISRMMLIENVKEYAIDYTGGGTSFSANATCLSNRCMLFHVEGGGLPAWTFSDEIKSDTVTPDFYPLLVTIEGIGSHKSDVVLIWSGLSLSFCKAINDELGLNINFETADRISSAGYYNLNGTHTSYPDTAMTFSAGEVAKLTSKDAACYRANTPGEDYRFYKVILTR